MYEFDSSHIFQDIEQQVDYDNTTFGSPIWNYVHVSFESNEVATKIKKHISQLPRNLQPIIKDLIIPHKKVKSELKYYVMNKYDLSEDTFQAAVL